MRMCAFPGHTAHAGRQYGRGTSGFGHGGARPPRATFPADLKHGNPSRSRTLSPMVGVRLIRTAGPFESYAGNSSAVHSD